jgi:hypothetical protein
MSAFRDSLPDDATRARFDAAIEAFARVLAAGADERDELYMTGGAEAVAAAAYVPGGPSREEIAATYMELRAEALEKQQRAAGMSSGLAVSADDISLSRVSAFRDSLPDEATRARYDQAIDGFAQVIADADQALMDRYAAGGAMAVARAAYVPGGLSVEELAAGWERLVEEARERQRKPLLDVLRVSNTGSCSTGLHGRCAAPCLVELPGCLPRRSSVGTWPRNRLVAAVRLRTCPRGTAPGRRSSDGVLPGAGMP